MRVMTIVGSFEARVGDWLQQPGVATVFFYSPPSRKPMTMKVGRTRVGWQISSCLHVCVISQGIGGSGVARRAAINPLRLD